MTFISYINDYKEPEKKIDEKKSSPRNFKSYIKKVNSKPVVVMCSENLSLIEDCKKLSIKYHIIKEKYMVEEKGDKVIIKDMFDENGYYISVNKKNTVVLDGETKIVEKLSNAGLRILNEKQIKETINENS